jgi:hypothetical protein
MATQIRRKDESMQYKKYTGMTYDTAVGEMTIIRVGRAMLMTQAHLAVTCHTHARIVF